MPFESQQSDYYIEVGRTFYNFAYLEWIVVWTAAKLSPNGMAGVPYDGPSSQIADTLQHLIETTTPALPTALREQLNAFNQSYRDAIATRDELVHAHPFTADGGMQELGGDGHKWPVENLQAAAKTFENAATAGDALFYGDLAKARP